MSQNIISVKNLTKMYGTTYALNAASFDFMAGQQYVIQGASGSGKSTLLYLIGGLDKPSAGSIFVQGKNISDMKDDELAHYRNGTVGFVFQFHFLLPSMNCLENLLLPAKISGRNDKFIQDSIAELAKYLEVTHCLEKMPYQLSGGEQQRINIIRALSLRPKLLLCDEPTGNLDSVNSEKVTLLLKNLAKQFEATLIIVTHDNKVASHFSEKLFMRDGRLLPQGANLNL